MSVYLYDEAILQKFSKWGLNNSATILSPEDIQNRYNILNDTRDDREITLPLITLNRNGNVTITNTNKRPLSYDALVIDRNKQKKEMLNAIPIELKYQLDVYTRYRKQADEYLRELTFNFINYPEIGIKIPYENVDYLHRSTIYIESEWADNSNVPERLVHGQFTRYTLNFKVDNAYLFDVRVRDVGLDFSIEIKSVENENTKEEMIKEKEIKRNE